MRFFQSDYWNKVLLNVNIYELKRLKHGSLIQAAPKSNRPHVANLLIGIKVWKKIPHGSWLYPLGSRSSTKYPFLYHKNTAHVCNYIIFSTWVRCSEILKAPFPFVLPLFFSLPPASVLWFEHKMPPKAHVLEDWSIDGGGVDGWLNHKGITLTNGLIRCWAFCWMVH